MKLNQDVALAESRLAWNRYLRKENTTMADMINIYLYGKKYEVPSDLTIMEAFEYAGYQLVRG